MLACFLITMSLGVTSCQYPGSPFTIGNNFPETVRVYFNGHNMGIITKGFYRIFYPGQVLTKNDSQLILEFKSSSGVVLYSHSYTWDELQRIEKEFLFQTYWIGPDTK